MKKVFFSIAISLIICNVFAQKIEVLTSGMPTSLRGLCVVNDNVIWVSGSNGKVGRSVTGGKNWSWFTVKGFEKTDFRDIEAFDASTAIIMGISEPAYILKTIDGGESWNLVYENKTRGMFLDAMDFADEKKGMVIGDPIDGKIFIATTDDGGNNWVEKQHRLIADSGEAFFASSGTNLRYFSKDNFYLSSGGTASNFFTANNKTLLPVVQGKESTGANSIDVYDFDKKKKRITIVGGDFLKDTITTNNCFYSNDGGNTWKAPTTPPHGYRSCVEYLSEKVLITCGTSGVDISKNGGRTWQLIEKSGYHVCRIAKQGSAVFLAGNKGTIAKLVWK